MELLKGERFESIQPAVYDTIIEARLSPCQKSQRGSAALIYLPDGSVKVMARDHNRPKDGKPCIPPLCWKKCGQYCDHAEKRVVDQLIGLNKGPELISMIHMKIKCGRVVRSDDLSCISCAREMRDLRVREFILYQSTGFVSYQPDEYYHLTEKWLKENKR